MPLTYYLLSEPYSKTKAKAYQLAESIVLGKAKVMGFENLEEARVKHAMKELAAASKGKRGRSARVLY
jgi:hypothetical protein